MGSPASLLLAVTLIFPSLVAGGGKKPLNVRPHEYYWGEGWAELGSDAGQAREKAKTRALGDLARNVRVSIRSTIIDVLGQSAGRPHESLESRIDTYANIPATRLDREEFLLHKPRRGLLICRVAVHRVRYDGEVHRDLMEKKNRALTEARRARTALNEGRLAEALQAIHSLQSRAATDFPGLTLEGVLDTPGKKEDVLGWALSQQDRIAGSLQLTCSPETIIFTADGRYDGPVTAHLFWTGPPGVNLDGISLQAQWTHRPQQVLSPGDTDKSGVALFSPVVDLFVEESTLEIGLRRNDGGPSVACQSDFHRRRSVVLAVRSDREEGRTLLSEFMENRLRRFPWNVRTETDGEKTPLGSESLVSVEVQTTLSRHPDGAIHRSVIKSNGKIYSGSKGKWVFRGKGPSAKGFGATPADAVQVALEDFLGKLGPWMDSRVKGLP
jgi:hypothetical protein